MNPPPNDSTPTGTRRRTRGQIEEIQAQFHELVSVPLASIARVERIHALAQTLPNDVIDIILPGFRAEERRAREAFDENEERIGGRHNTAYYPGILTDVARANDLNERLLNAETIRSALEFTQQRRIQQREDEEMDRNNELLRAKRRAEDKKRADARSKRAIEQQSIAAEAREIAVGAKQRTARLEKEVEQQFAAVVEKVLTLTGIKEDVATNKKRIDGIEQQFAEMRAKDADEDTKDADEDADAKDDDAKDADTKDADDAEDDLKPAAKEE